MEPLWLEYYCHPDCEPMKNIMRLPREEAFTLAKELADAHPETTAFYRFADFANYYPRRLMTDRAMLGRFLALGGRPESEHPLSFVLGSSDYLHKWFGSGKVLHIPLSAAPGELLTFTLGDSMSTLARDGELALLTLPMLEEAMAQHPEGAKGWLRDAQKEHTYIEVQLWGDFTLLEEPS